MTLKRPRWSPETSKFPVFLIVSCTDSVAWCIRLFCSRPRAPQIREFVSVRPRCRGLTIATLPVANFGNVKKSSLACESSEELKKKHFLQSCYSYRDGLFLVFMPFYWQKYFMTSAAAVFWSRSWLTNGLYLEGRFLPPVVFFLNL